ncbi:MAG: sulfate permease [Bacteroidota bacterium]|nr:MAG: sulfate permease [Bacteroidota bacterium]
MKSLTGILKSFLPIMDWGAKYNGKTFTNDLIVALIVTMMLIPQSLAYALLAGLPPEIGLYASMAPLVLYAIFGTSRALAVGPVAVASLMTAAAAGQLASQGSPEYIGAAVALAMVSGLLLIAMGFLKLGFLSNFLSHPVIAGFITASGIQIAASQLGPVLGIHLEGETFLDIAVSFWHTISNIHLITAAVGIGSLVFLFWVRSGLKPLLIRFGMKAKTSDILVKVGPVVAIIITIIIVAGLGLADKGVKIVGKVPGGLPKITMPPLDFGLWVKILVPALLISIVGYVESISVALTLAAKKRQRVDPDQELIALGASNIGSAISGGFPVTGGFARSVVNFDAGAETPAAGAFTAVGIALTTLFLTPLLFFLPNATLAATIIVAVLSLVNFKALKHAWVFSKSDFAAMAVTILITLIAGIEPGLIAGVALSIVLYLYSSSRPHIAIVGQIPGTTHFRNVKRHTVETDPEILSIRIDESLFFPNARYIEDFINNEVAANPQVKHVILECPAVNTIDISALESLEAINVRLKDGGITFHLSEVKGPIMDRLNRSHFPQVLTGKIYLTHMDAVSEIKTELKTINKF